MKNPTKKPGGWSVARQHLNTWDKAALISLIKDLYEVTGSNRAFIDARCQADTSGEDVLAPYRERIVEQFFPKRKLMGDPKLGEARKAIREYRKATGNLTGTAELLMTYVENGTQFTHEYGDIGESFYNSIESALNELAKLLMKEGPELYSMFSERLEALETMSDGIGWDFHDHISGVVEDLSIELSR